MAEKHGHSHSHSHSGHGHSHSHSHGAASGRVGVAFALNLSFAIIELIGGLLTNSMAVLSDALHDFGDALALGMAWWMERKSHQASDARFTYGYRRFSPLSALITGVILLSGSIWIVANAIPRILNPQPVEVKGVMALAFLGIAVNGIAFLRLSGGASLNERMLRWHFIEDLSGWVLVLFGSILMYFGGWPWIDPLLALILSSWIGWNVLKHLMQTAGVFMQATPDGLRDGEAESYIRTIEKVQDVHHTHIWSIDGESHILTTHVVIPTISIDEIHAVKVKIKKGLKEKFGILEATIEFETQSEACVDPSHDGKN